MLLTRSPLINGARTASSFDLHVLSTPPAFVLSQDQTLRTKTKTSKPRKTHHTTTAQQAIPTKNNSKTKNRHKKQTHYRVHKQHPTPNHNTPQQSTTTRQGNHHNPTTRAAATKHKPTHPHPPTSNPHNVTPTTPHTTHSTDSQPNPPPQATTPPNTHHMTHRPLATHKSSTPQHSGADRTRRDAFRRATQGHCASPQQDGRHQQATPDQQGAPDQMVRGSFSTIEARQGSQTRPKAKNPS